MSLVIDALKKKENNKSIYNRISSRKRWKPIIFLLFLVPALIYLSFNFLPDNRVLQTVKQKNPASPNQIKVKSEEPALISEVRTVDDQVKKDAQVFNMRGIEAFQKKDYSSAISYFKQAISRDADNPEMYNNLGIVYLNKNSLLAAKAEFLNAIRLKELFPEALNNMALVFEKLGEAKRSERLYKKALEILPEFPDANLNYAILLDKNGRSLEARRYYNNYLSIAGKSDFQKKKLVKSRMRKIGAVK